MIRFALVFSIATLLLNAAGCSHSVDAPITSKLKDPATYSWTMDTLSYAPSANSFRQTIMEDMWGLNDTLIYAGGHNAYYGYGSLWKFDGKKWGRILINAHEGGPLHKSIEFSAIRGFSPNDIYAFGTSWSNLTGDELPSTAAIHFNGIQWSEISMPKGQGIKSIVAVSPSQIYCGGWYDGQVYRFDGSQWSVDTVKARQYPELYIDVDLMGINYSTQDLYFQTEQFRNTSDPFYYKQIMKYAKNQSFLVDSAYNDPPWGGMSFWQSSEGTMYSGGAGGIYRLSDGKWTPFLSADRIFAIYGCSEEHIFAVSTHAVYFYDGTGWKIIAPYHGTTFEINIWCSETQVFICYSDGTDTYVLHGQ